MATNFRGKIGEIGLLNFIRRWSIPKLIGILLSQCWWRDNSDDDLATSCKQFCELGSV